MTGGLRGVLDGRWPAVRAEARQRLGELPPPEEDLSSEQHRAQVLAQLLELARSGYPELGFPKEYGGGGDVGGSLTAFEMLGFGDLSLMVKAGVQWGLFGGAVEALGTARHHDPHLADIMSGRLLGCFAMTELGDGSDRQHPRPTGRHHPAAG